MKRSLVEPIEENFAAAALLQRAAFLCMWLQYDHILPHSRGGENTLDNIVVTCAPCNFSRMESTLDEAQLLHPLKVVHPRAGRGIRPGMAWSVFGKRFDCRPDRIQRLAHPVVGVGRVVMRLRSLRT